MLDRGRLYCQAVNNTVANTQDALKAAGMTIMVGVPGPEDAFFAAAAKLGYKVIQVGRMTAVEVGGKLLKTSEHNAALKRIADETNSMIALRNANGHAFEKHFHQLGFSCPEEMAAFIYEIISNQNGMKKLRDGRYAYWDKDSGLLVNASPNIDDLGTVYKPDRGKSDFDILQ